MNYQKGSTMGCLLVVFYSTIIFFFFKIFIKFKSQEKEIKLEIRRPDYLFAILRVVSSVNISYLRKKKKSDFHQWEDCKAELSRKAFTVVFLHWYTPLPQNISRSMFSLMIKCALCLAIWLATLFHVCSYRPKLSTKPLELLHSKTAHRQPHCR